MPNYQYSALSETGSRVTGKLLAKDLHELDLLVTGLGLELITARKKIIELRPFRVSDSELAIFCFQIEQMLSSGFTLHSALKELAGQQRKAMLVIVQQLIIDIQNGSALSKAFSRYPTIFDPVFINLIRVAELSGQTSKVFTQLGQIYQWQDQVKKQIKKMLINPLFTLAIVTLASIFLLTFLVPQLAQFLNQLHRELPLITKIILSLSNALNQCSITTWLLVSAALSILFSVILTSKSVKILMMQILLSMPYLGLIYQKLLVIDFLKRYVLLIENAIPLDEAILICSEGVNNANLQKKLLNIYEQIRFGRTISEAFASQNIFPILMIQMISMGEKSGDINQALTRLLNLYESEIDGQVNALIKLTEPLMTLILGALLSLLMMGILTPIYQSFEQFNF